jgi:ElaB/YqjD/DUF883 family membrane-anchored ribosome-binding protein
MTDMKNDPDKQSSNPSKGSGSDTASAAKISAGTSVGNVGESPMPHAQPGTAPTDQSSTPASHTSKPLGGQSAGSQENQPQASSEGATETVKQAAQGATDSMRQAGAQAKEKAGEAVEQASEWAHDTYERGRERFGRGRSRGARSNQRLHGARQGMQQYVAENPVMVGLVGLAAGLLIGALLPRTRREDEAMGEWADDVREQGLRHARDMAERGREYVDEAFSGDDPRFGKHENEFRTGQSPTDTFNRH